MSTYDIMLSELASVLPLFILASLDHRRENPICPNRHFGELASIFQGDDMNLVDALLSSPSSVMTILMTCMDNTYGG